MSQKMRILLQILGSVFQRSVKARLSRSLTLLTCDQVICFFRLTPDRRFVFQFLIEGFVSLKVSLKGKFAGV